MSYCKFNSEQTGMTAEYCFYGRDCWVNIRGIIGSNGSV